MHRMFHSFTAACLLGALALATSQPAEAEGLSAREIQQAVDGYLGRSGSEVMLVGGPSQVGYDRGFFVRSGGFLMRHNLTLQARYEWMDWDQVEPVPGGDLSGFSLPRATWKVSGYAPCNVCYYMQMEFGHFGRQGLNQLIPVNPGLAQRNLGPQAQSDNFDVLREAWAEWCPNRCLNIRAGQIMTPSTRQLMVAPELQQFSDISLASAWVGQSMPGWTDRNRDHGVMVHGTVGSKCQPLTYMFAVTNGDGGDSIRNVLDTRTSDNLAYSGRINWAFAKEIGYQEGSLGQTECGWYGEIGAWGYYYADRVDKNHSNRGDYLRYGVDVALGYGGLSFTGAASWQQDTDVPTVPAGPVAQDDDVFSYLAQVGYRLPGSKLELAARYSGYDFDGDIFGDGSANEIAVALTYYHNNHFSKITLDAAMLSTDGTGFLLYDRYPGYAGSLTNGNDAMLVRLQWQLAL